MRKLLSLVLIALLMISLAACTDPKIEDNRFNVIFYVGADSTYVDSYFDVLENSTIPIPEEPTKNKFAFAGWYKDIEHLQPWDFDTDVVTQSLVLYAKWISEVWSISFVLNEELSEEFNNPNNIPTQFDADTNVYLPVVKRPGGSFKGWILVPPEEYTLDMTIYRYTNDLPTTQYTEFVLYPVFNNNKYLITFNPRMAGVATPAPKAGVEYGSIIGWVPVINDTATHRFVGWFTKNGTNTGDWGIQIVNGDYWVIPASALLYGRWEEK